VYKFCLSTPDKSVDPGYLFTGGNSEGVLFDGDDDRDKLSHDTLQVQEEDGTWRSATLFKLKNDSFSMKRFTAFRLAATNPH
jgi:hypothetical protein